MRNKFIFSVVGGFSFGVLWGWALTADHFKKKVKEKEDYILALRAAREEKAASTVSEVPDPIQTPEGPTLFELIENSPGVGSSGEGVTGEADEEVDEAETEQLRANLQRTISEYTADPDNIEHFLHSANQTLIQDNTPPFVISREKYSWDSEEGDFYDKVTVTYYPRDRVMLDEDQSVLEDVANVIGWKNLAQFGGESGSPDVVFVRNRRLMIDYEVVKEEDDPLPLHIKYGMDKEEFEINRASGLMRLREEDR
jgi:hypothetical protein